MSLLDELKTRRNGIPTQVNHDTFDVREEDGIDGVWVRLRRADGERTFTCPSCHGELVAEKFDNVDYLQTEIELVCHGCRTVQRRITDMSRSVAVG